MPPNKPAEAGAEAVVSIPELRDYGRINAELARHLSSGRAHVRLTGAQGHRLLLAGLCGPWSALVEIEGDAGPELAASLDAPNLLVVCRGAVADGAGRALRSGRLLILGCAGDAVGYTLAGGSVVVAGSAGHRAGLGQTGGTLVLLGSAGRLAGERQTGGLLVAQADRVGPHARFGYLGGRMLLLPTPERAAALVDPVDFWTYQQAMQPMEPWIDDAKS